MFPRLNEDASAGAVVTFIIALCLMGLIIVFMGPLIDRVIISTAGGTIGTIVSQDRLDTLNLLILAWKALPFIFLFGWAIWTIKTNMEKVPGVD